MKKLPALLVERYPVGVKIARNKLTKDCHPMSDISPCLDCGACCATFRVSFYGGEAASAPGGAAPGRLIEEVPPQLSCMRGSNQPQPRCFALMGEVGSSVRCTIY